MSDAVITEMPEQEAWDFLGQHAFGRLAYVIAGEPDIVPINYCADNGRLVFRTAEGSKLFAVVTGGKVAFEVDAVRSDHANSVIVHGQARLLEGSEAEAAEELPLRAWVPTVKYNLVEITPESVTGRRFLLGPEPERL